MKKFVNFLSHNRDHAVQFIVDVETDKGSTETQRRFMGKVIEYDDVGILVGRIEGSATVLEAYPWNAIRAILTTLPADTDLTIYYNMDALL